MLPDPDIFAVDIGIFFPRHVQKQLDIPRHPVTFAVPAKRAVGVLDRDMKVDKTSTIAPPHYICNATRQAKICLRLFSAV